MNRERCLVLPSQKQFHLALASAGPKRNDVWHDRPSITRGKLHTSLGALQKVMELAAILDELDADEQLRIQEILDRHGAGTVEEC